MVQAGYNYARQWDAEAVPEAESGRQVKKVVTRKVSNRKKILGKAGLCLFIYALLLVALCIQSAVLGYQIVQLESDIHGLDRANAHLEYQIAELNSLGRVQQIAEGELKMFKPENSIALAAFTPVKASASCTVAEQKDEEEPKNDFDRPLEKLARNLLQLAAAE